MEFDLSMGTIPPLPGFIGPMGFPVRVADGEYEIAIFNVMDALPELGPDMRPLLMRLDDDDDADVGGGSGGGGIGAARGLNAGWPCDETRNGPEFCDI